MTQLVDPALRVPETIEIHGTRTPNLKASKSPGLALSKIPDSRGLLGFMAPMLHGFGACCLHIFSFLEGLEVNRATQLQGYKFTVRRCRVLPLSQLLAFMVAGHTHHLRKGSALIVCCEARPRRTWANRPSPYRILSTQHEDPPAWLEDSRRIARPRYRAQVLES